MKLLATANLRVEPRIKGRGKMLKKQLMLLAALVVLAWCVPVQGATVYVGMHQVKVDGQAVTPDDEFYAAVGPELKYLGCTFEYKPGEYTAQVTTPTGKIYIFRANSRTVNTPDGHFLKLAAPCKLEKGRFLLPLKAAAKLLNLSFHGKNEQVSLATKVLDYEIRQSKEGLEVVLQLTGKVEWSKGVLKDPDRVFVDLKGAVWVKPAEEKALDSPLAGRVRISQNALMPDRVRVVVDLKKAVPSEVESEAGGTRIRLLLGKAVKEAPALKEAKSDTLQSCQVGVGVVKSRLEELKVATPAKTRASFELKFDKPAGYALKVTRKPLVYTFTFFDCGLAQGFKQPEQKVKVAGLKGWKLYALATPAPQVKLELKLDEVTPFYLKRDPKSGVLRLELDLAHTKGPVVVLDPGHGGRDPGAVGGTGLTEEEVVLDIALRARKILEAKGFRVMMTRQEDVFTELYSRAYYANALGAKAFVSIHCNAFKRNTQSGTGVYWNTPQSEEFAKLMYKHLVPALGLPGKGIFNRRFVVCRCTQMPSVLVEVAYIDNDKDERLLKQAKFRQKAAEAIAAALEEEVEGKK